MVWDGTTARRIALRADWAAHEFPWERHGEEEPAHPFRWYTDWNKDHGEPGFRPERYSTAMYVLLSEQPENYLAFLERHLDEVTPDPDHLTQAWLLLKEDGYYLRLRLIERIEDPSLQKQADHWGEPAQQAVAEHRAAIEVCIDGEGSAAGQPSTQESVLRQLVADPSASAYWIPGR